MKKGRSKKGILTISAVLFISGGLLWGTLLDIIPPLSFFSDADASKIPAWISEIPFTHRGLHHTSAGIPENSLAAFRNSVKQHFGIELDVWRTKDGKLVVAHYNDLQIDTGTEGFISELSYVEVQERRLNGTNERIPLLQDVLGVIRGQVPVLIELKNEGEVGSFEAQVYDLIRTYQGPFAIISFNPQSLAWFKTNAPQILRGQISEPSEKSMKTNNLSFLDAKIRQYYLYNWHSRPHFMIYELSKVPSNVSLRLLRRYRPLIVYGVRNEEDLKKIQGVVQNYIFDHIVDIVQRQEAHPPYYGIKGSIK